MEMSPEQFNELMLNMRLIYDAIFCATLAICFGLGAIKGGQR